MIEPPERIAQELRRLGERPGTGRALRLLERVGALELLAEPFGWPSAREEREAALGRVEGLPEPLALEEVLALLAAARDPGEIEKSLRALRLARGEIQAVVALRRDLDQARALGRTGAP